jgi:hypothetical protein
MSHELLERLDTAIPWHPVEGRPDIHWEVGWFEPTKVMEAVRFQLPGEDSESLWNRLQTANRDLPLKITKEILPGETCITIFTNSNWPDMYTLHFYNDGRWVPKKTRILSPDDERLFIISRVYGFAHILLHLHPNVTAYLAAKRADVIQTTFTAYKTGTMEDSEKIQLYHLWDRWHHVISVSGYATTTSGVVEVNEGSDAIDIPIPNIDTSVHIPVLLQEQEFLANFFFPYKLANGGYDVFGITTTPIEPNIT